MKFGKLNIGVNYMLEYSIKADGSFSISGKEICLVDCYPAIEGTAIRPVNVCCGENSIIYQLSQGTLALNFTDTDDDRLEISGHLSGYPGCHDVSPVAHAKVLHADRQFVQGFGMEGPSGIYGFSDEIPSSYGLTGLIGESGVMTVYAKDHTRYSAMFDVVKCRTMSGNVVSFSAGFNLEGTAGEDCVLPALYIAEASDLSAGLQAAALAIAESMGARHDKGPAAFWCSWYHAYETLNIRSLAYYLEGLKANPQLPFQYVELDAGYVPSLGDWLETNSRYPNGLKEAADMILAAGYQPGIWIGPYIVGDQSRLFREHPDWVLKDLDGKPFVQLRSYTEPKIWGNADSDYYVLDVSHPDAFAYLENVFKTMRSWGFTFFKTDFLFWNMHDTATVRRYDPSATSVELMRKLMTMIRRVIGEESYLLGCIAPFMPLIGIVDGMRIAGDGGARWAEPYGPVNLLRELPCDNYFNHIFWQNDPDCLLLRDFDTFLTESEVRSLALMQAISGGAISTSDPLQRMSEDRRELLGFIWPKEKVVPSLPHFGSDEKLLVMTHRLKQGGLVFAMNPADEPVTFFCEIEEWFGDKLRYQYRYEWEKDAFSGSVLKPYIAQTLKPHESLLVFASDKPLGKKPSNIWTW